MFSWSFIRAYLPGPLYANRFLKLSSKISTSIGMLIKVCFCLKTNVLLVNLTVIAIILAINLKGKIRVIRNLIKN